MCSSPIDTARCSRSPSRVRCSPRAWRWNRVVPRKSSRSWICRLTADWVTDSSSAARVKFMCRAAASNTTRLLVGGSVRRSATAMAERGRRPLLIAAYSAKLGSCSARISFIASKWADDWSAYSSHSCAVFSATASLMMLSGRPVE